MSHIILVVYLVTAMAVLSAYAGGSLPGSHKLDRCGLTWLPEAIFAAHIGVFAAVTYAGSWGGVAVTVWSYLWMQTGHGTVLQWGRDPSQAVGRTQTLTPVVNWLAERFGFTLGDVNYCRLFMAVKGFLIGLPVGGLPLAILWPLAYEIGVRVGKHEVSELLSGAFAGISIFLILSIF